MRYSKPLILLLFLIILECASEVSAQEINISFASSISAREQFSNSYGYQIGYSKTVKNKHKLGLSINHLYSHFSGKESNHFSLNDGKTYYREEESNNQRFGISTYFLFRIFSKNKSSLFIGPEISINYYIYNKSIYQYPLENPELISDFDYVKYDSNKLGFGAKVSYYNRITDNWSIAAFVIPEIALFSSGGCLISINPSPWIHAHIGLVYHFRKKELSTK